MERLSMTHPRSHVMITGGYRMTSLTAEIEAGEVAIIKYLASCYRRAFEECKKWKVCPLISYTCVRQTSSSVCISHNSLFGVINKSSTKQTFNVYDKQA